MKLKKLNKTNIYLHICGIQKKNQMKIAEKPKFQML